MVCVWLERGFSYYLPHPVNHIIICDICIDIIYIMKIVYNIQYVIYVIYNALCEYRNVRVSNLIILIVKCKYVKLVFCKCAQILYTIASVLPVTGFSCNRLYYY